MRRFLLILAVLFPCCQLYGRTLYVGSSHPYGSIQSAISDANDGDTIIVSAGTYYENIDFIGRVVTVRSLDPNDPNVVAATIINGSTPADPNRASTVTFRSGEDVNSVLSGFTITGGSVHGCR